MAVPTAQAATAPGKHEKRKQGALKPDPIGRQINLGMADMLQAKQEGLKDSLSDSTLNKLFSVETIFLFMRIVIFFYLRLDY